jgi:mono/diheme cytochrome c family protein/cytochrome b subunit of formate dehydrogenase
MGKERPKMPRYNFMEKAEYWAMVWGLILMGLTGLMLWNPVATTNLLPGEFIPAAKAAHGAEAVLAVLAIILWHFYHVHIKQFNKSMFTGQITRHEMIEEHGEELEAIESGRVAPLPAAATMRQRMAIFVPVAAVLSLVLVGLTFFFITFEDTAIATIPPISDVPVLVQATPSELQPTTAPVAEGTEAPAVGSPDGASGDLAWNGVIGAMMAENCAGCHGSMGGFSAETYEDMMQAVTPGDPDASSVVQVQVAGGHPGQLDEASLATLVEWVAAGAPEGEAASDPGAEPTSAVAVPTEAPADAGPAAELSWDGSIGPMFQEDCTRCHGNQGGFNAETLEGVYQALIPGDPENSQVIITQYSRHPKMFSEQEFNAIFQWIAEGAPRH